MVLVDAPPAFCTFAAPRSTTCTRNNEHDVTVTFPPQFALRELSLLNQPVRPFGPHCHPAPVFFLCTHAIDTSPQPTGPGPNDAARARHNIEDAFTKMFVFSPDGLTLPAVDDGRSLVAQYANQIECAASATVTVNDVRFITARAALVDYTVRPSNAAPLHATAAAVLRNNHWLAGREAVEHPLAFTPRC
jgi:hypothetical protein